MAESPQAYDGDCIRLGGSLIWCHTLELSVREDGRLEKRCLVPVSGFDAAIADMPTELAEEAQRQFANLSKIHAPLTVGERTLRFDQPQVMGIMNITPDSFSDGGKFTDDPQAAADSAFAMLAAGAAIVDIGGESTRPGAAAVWEGDEIDRIVPVISKLAASGAVISVDTRKSAVMQAGLDAGAHIVNDVSALAYDDRSLETVAMAGCAVVLMHAPSTGANPHLGGNYANVVTEVFDYLSQRIAAAITGGVEPSKIMVDPGIGFGKSLQENLALVNNLALFHALGHPIVFGASRKRMIGALSNEAAADRRLAGSLALALQAISSGAHIVRAHDAYETVQAVRVWRGLRDSALTQA